MGKKAREDSGFKHIKKGKVEVREKEKKPTPPDVIIHQQYPIQHLRERRHIIHRIPIGPRKGY